MASHDPLLPPHSTSALGYMVYASFICTPYGSITNDAPGYKMWIADGLKH